MGRCGGCARTIDEAPARTDSSAAHPAARDTRPAIAPTVPVSAFIPFFDTAMIAVGAGASSGRA
jgi:hypothetical protein